MKRVVSGACGKGRPDIGKGLSGTFSYIFTTGT